MFTASTGASITMQNPQIPATCGSSSFDWSEDGVTLLSLPRFCNNPYSFWDKAPWKVDIVAPASIMITDVVLGYASVQTVTQILGVGYRGIQTTYRIQNILRFVQPNKPPVEVVIDEAGGFTVPSGFLLPAQTSGYSLEFVRQVPENLPEYESKLVGGLVQIKQLYGYVIDTL